MMSDVFNLQEYDALCRSVLGTKLPFPVTEIFADAEFLIGGNRPEPVIPGFPVKVSDAAKVAIPGYKNGDPKAATCPEKGVYPSYTPSS
jgi:hypothetical protein